MAGTRPRLLRAWGVSMAAGCFPWGYRCIQEPGRFCRNVAFSRVWQSVSHCISATRFLDFDPKIELCDRTLDNGLATPVVYGPMHDGPGATWHTRSRDDPDRAAR